MFYLNLTGMDTFLVGAHSDRREYLPNYSDINGNGFVGLAPVNFRKLGFEVDVNTVRKYEIK